MAITKQRKEQLVAQYNAILTQSDGFVIIESKGLNVQQVEDLRAKIRDVDGQYVVTKNTLFKIALTNTGWPVPENGLKGPVSIAFGKGNFPKVARVILDFMKDLSEKMALKGGVVGGNVLSGPQVETVSNLPPLDDLRAQLAGLIVAPATGLVSVISAATGQVVNVLQAYVDKDTTAA